MMINQKSKTVFLFVLAVSLVAALYSYYIPVSPAADLRILWTNDTHGYLSPLYHREEGDDRFVERAKREGRVGGFAYISAIVNRQRKEMQDRTLFLDSGDAWHGTVVPVRLAGAPVVQVMNAMGYDAMVPGNVEFFYDRKILENLFSQAEFPIIAANFYDAQWGERVSLRNVQPYIIKQIGEFKVAIIGMTYHWMSKVADHPQWSFGLRLEEVQSDIDYLREQEQVDVVVMLSHMGWKVDARYAGLVSGIDVIVGAHTHDILYRPTIVFNKDSGRNVLIVQCGSHGKMVGQLDLRITSSGIKDYEQTLFPIRSRDLQPDPDIAALIEKLRAPYKEELERVIAQTDTLLYRQGTWQSPADNLVTDALRARTRQDVVVTQPGRFGATILPGPVTVEDVYNIVPTESRIYNMKFSGSSLRGMFEGAVDNVIARDPLERIGSNMWRFSGVEMSVDVTKSYPDRIGKMHINGEPVDDEQQYSVAEFNMFLRNSPSATDVLQTELIGPHEVIAYIEEQGKIAPLLDKRITDADGRIMSDHAHLNEDWTKSGRHDVDIDNDRIYLYRGSLND